MTSGATPFPGPVAVVGVGLIGGSLGLALRARAGVGEVRGVDPDPGALRRGLEVGAITHAVTSVEEACDGCAAVVVAAPVGEIAGIARRALAASGPACLVTDVGSTKAGVVAALTAAERERFIGGHPVCGAETGGVEHARENLFERATWFLTPAPEAHGTLIETLHSIVVAVGARPVAVDAGAHDDLMALVSHLPHVVASALIHQAAATAPGGREALRSAGPSFSDLTRVAGANPPLWADILIENRDALAAALRDQRARLQEVEAALARSDRGWLLDWIAAAADGRERLRAAAATPAVERPWRLVVNVPNRPGVLSEITVALGHAHVNIEDLSLLPAPGDEGELALVVSGEDAARTAAAMVRDRGYAVRVEPET
ncbi:MAG: prephenate dehydrogenase/arogenate dehydrogenase family protein [Actinomycetota bacterium]